MLTLPCAVILPKDRRGALCGALGEARDAEHYPLTGGGGAAAKFRLGPDNFGPASTNISPKPAVVGPVSNKFELMSAPTLWCPNRTKVGATTMLGLIRPSLARNWQDLGPIRPTLANIGKLRAAFGHDSPNVGQTFASLDRFLTAFIEISRLVADFDRLWAEIDPEFDKIRTDFDKFGPLAASVGQHLPTYSETWAGIGPNSANM